MTPVLPETAPFNLAQRAWLNGFIAGLFQPDAPSGELPSGGVGVEVGPAEEVEDENPPWHDDTLELDERLAMAEDRPVKDKLMSAMAQMDCGACGYVCRSYANAIADGSENDLTKCVPGGKDTSKTLKTLVKEAGDEIGNTSASVTVNGQAVETKPATGYDRNHPFPSTLLAVKKLNREGSAKDTRFVALDLTGSGIKYEPGDSVGVYPVNDAKLVDKILEALGYTGNEPVLTPNNTLTPLREALETCYTITKITSTTCEAFVSVCEDEAKTAWLNELADDEDELETFDLLELITALPGVRPAPGDLVNALNALQPRLYSISSSQAMYPDEVHLTIGAVRYEMKGRVRSGVASTFFADRADMGERVRIFIHKAHGFSLPEDGNKPVIMVGPGTGIAPFRAFLQHRKVNGHGGKNWLFFGDQHEATDYLYDHELNTYLDDKLLTRIDLAFSRDQEEKIYVQNRMLEHGAEIWAWLNEGAHFYVCGDASRMAKDVDAALRAIVQEYGSMGEDAATAYIKQLSADNRIQKDVY